MDTNLLVGDKPIVGIDDVKAMTISMDSLSVAEQSKMTVKQIMALRAPTPKQYIKKFKGRGGKELSYVPVALYIRKLNYVFGYCAWSFEVVKAEVIENQAVVQGRLSVPGIEMSVSQFGGHPVARSQSNGDAVDIGDTFKSAASDCLKKCCSMLGMFADVYSPEEFIDLEEAAAKSKAKAQDKPKKAGPTPEQRERIDELAQALNLTKAVVTKRARELYHVSITEITPTQADGLIKMLEKKLVEKNSTV